MTYPSFSSEPNFLTDDFVPHPESTRDSISTSILDRARQGDEVAFQQMTHLYGGLVYHWCRSSGLGPEDSEDVGQQVFVTVSKSLKTFRRETEQHSFRGWLRTITRSRIIDHVRKNGDRPLAIGDSRLEKVPDVIGEDSVDEVHRDKIALLDRAMKLIHGEFSDNDSQAFLCVMLEGKSAKEAASEIGITTNSVYIAKSRILKRLREEFGELLID